MSRAYICDRCGLIAPEEMAMRSVWLMNPIFFKDESQAIHLCEKCYREFEDEYLANLKSEGEHV